MQHIRVIGVGGEPYDSRVTQRGALPTHRSREVRSGPHVDGSIDKPIKRLGFRVFRGSTILILAVVAMALISMLFQGWLLGGVSFQQTTVGGLLWPIVHSLWDQVHPMT